MEHQQYNGSLEEPTSNIFLIFIYFSYICSFQVRLVAKDQINGTSFEQMITD